MRFTSLGSGSSGNAMVVASGANRVLLDCGFGLADMAERLARRGLTPDDLDAILVTHEHSDHAGGVARFARRHGVPVWLSHGTLAMLETAFADQVEIKLIAADQAFAIGDLRIEPYTVPHDAREPLQFVFGDGDQRLGVLTDAGCVTPHMRAVLDGCAALVIECNHDPEMLRAGRYPRSLKERVAGRFGHLSNAEAAELLAGLDRSRLRHVVAAHLSEDNNTPALARAALCEALDCAPDWVGVADRHAGFDWREL